MKTRIFLFLFGLGLVACAPTNSRLAPKETNPYSHFNSLSDALKSVPGLLITGTGRQATIRMTRSLQPDRGPLFIVNGRNMGYNYQQVNDAVQMHAVEYIRVLRGLADRTRSGQASTSGIIEIRTK